MCAVFACSCFDHGGGVIAQAGDRAGDLGGGLVDRLALLLCQQAGKVG